jgi:hypothetical protein
MPTPLATPPWPPAHRCDTVIGFDPLKRLRILEQRGLEFLDAPRVIAERTVEFKDLGRN